MEEVDSSWDEIFEDFNIDLEKLEPYYPEKKDVFNSVVQYSNLMEPIFAINKKPQGCIQKPKLFNRTLYENIVDFICLHYNTNRTDSEFWRYMTNNKTKWQNRY
jgi:hypothetical protein